MSEYVISSTAIKGVLKPTKKKRKVGKIVKKKQDEPEGVDENDGDEKARGTTVKRSEHLGIYDRLPHELTHYATVTKERRYIGGMLFKTVPKRDIRKMLRGDDSQWIMSFNSIDDNQSSKQKNKKNKKPKSLTRKKLDKMKLKDLPKTHWNYDNFLNYNIKWKSYMKTTYFNNKIPNRTDPEYEAFQTALSRCELIGAKIKVVRAKNPSLIGIEGILIREGKCSISVITKTGDLKIIDKRMSVYQIMIDNINLTIFGNNLLVRPHERATRKLKNFLQLTME